MLGLLLALSCTTREQDSSPSILLITIDTIRADHLGYAGYEAADTPALDALAARGRWFSQATTPLPRTTPALASLATGRWPHHHGSREVGRPLQEGRTVAEILKDAGWNTVGMSAIRVASPKQNLDRGFDAFEVHHDARATDLTEHAWRLVDRLPTEPTFLWIHYADPHFPYEPAPEQTGVPDAPVCRTLIADAAAKRVRRPLVYADHEGRATEALADCTKLYDAEITAVDRAVATLLDRWTTKFGPDAWVAVSADHGENLGEQGLFFEHGPNVHDASLRIPMIVAGPGVTAGRDDGVARLEDLHPTLLELAGLPATPGIDGISLVPRLQGREGGPTVAVAESGSALQPTLTDYVSSGRRAFHCLNDAQHSLCDRRKKTVVYDHVADPGLTRPIPTPDPALVARLEAARERWPVESARERTARTPTHKLVQRPDLAGGYTTTLYALPDDTTDVAADHPAIVAELTAALEDWGAPTAGGTARSDAELDALRSLGYVE
jgi:arylsulfatase